MVQLTRTVRFAVNDGEAVPGPAYNSFAGAPAIRGHGRHYELTITCAGSVDNATGYFLNIKAIDQAVRSVAIPMIEQACRVNPSSDPALTLHSLIGPLNAALGNSILSVSWNLSPYYSITMMPTSLASPSSKLTAVVRQHFDFAAAHRLHSPHLSDQANADYFGKCNNPMGHGHNYRIEPAVRIPIDPSGSLFTLNDLERITAKSLIDRFDHKHLNIDTPEFDQSRGGVNPSVENIAKVFFDILRPAIAASGTGADLESIRVWETEKTSCTYPA